MFKLDPRIYRLGGAVLTLVLTSCGGGSTGSGATASVPGPITTIAAPLNGAIVKTSPATIDGTVNPPDATVTVGNVPATVVNGRFSAAVQLNEGPNALAVVAKSASGQTTTTLDVTLNTNEICGAGDTFTVDLPGLVRPIDPSTEGLTDRKLSDDSVTLPDGCDVYAILVHGYGRDDLFDELMFYKLAKWVAEHNGYVHWSWWNNFLAEYMARPLHINPQTSWGDPNYPYPGDITEWGTKVKFAQGGSGKAVPDEDNQFQADAQKVLEAIRAHDPNAIVIVAGHSMGGNAVIRLGANTTVPIDLLAPIDAVGNRNLPEGQGSSLAYATGLQSATPGEKRYRSGNETFNWTRWRATHNFQGWIWRDCARNALGICKNLLTSLFQNKTECVVVNPTPQPYKPTTKDRLAIGMCPPLYRAASVQLPSQIRRLYYRWQRETFFPFDWTASYRLGFTGAKWHDDQPFDVKYHNYQRAVDQYSSSELPPPATLTTAPKTCRFDTEKDPSGAKSFDGVLLNCRDWDGHGEIIGMRATKSRAILEELPPQPTKENLNPLAATADWKDGKWVRTTPWSPIFAGDDTACADADCAAAARRKALIEMAQPGQWEFEPENPNLDLVVNDLVAIADDLWAQRAATPSGGPDVTPPTSTASLDIAPTAYGWNNTNVVVTISAVDEEGGSGVTEISYTMTGATTGSGVVEGDTVALPITAEGTTNIEYFARDNAGNTEDPPNTLAVNIDETPPTIDASIDPPPNENGWNNTDVTVTFTADDALSGIDTVTDPVTLTDEGANQEVIGVATDRAGNTASVSVVVNIDKTPPVISGLPQNCELWPPDHKMVHVADVIVSDALSGVADSSLNAVSSEPETGPSYGNFAPDVQIDNGTVQLRAERYSLNGRTYDLTATATDVAGNTAQGNATCLVPHDQGH